jgi:hypothetical protein
MIRHLILHQEWIHCKLKKITEENYMMHGKFNADIFCRVIEQILSERDENIEVKVSLISKEEADEMCMRLFNMSSDDYARKI